MAHETYIGVNNIAQNVNKIWIGDNGVAKKVKRGYIGDANGIARLFFIGGYVWNKYNCNVQYKWSKYTVQNSKTLLKSWTWNLDTYGEIDDFGYSRAILTVSASSYSIQNGKVVITGGYNVVSLRGDQEFSNTQVLILGRDVLESSIFYQAVTSSVTLSWSNSDDFNYVVNGILGKYQARTTSGSFIEYVYSSNSSAYPNGGQSGNYWYSGRTVEYSQGSYIDQVESNNPSAYPDNGRGSDGYWYVKVGS